MSDYQTSINDLYKLRSDLTALKANYDVLLPKFPQPINPALRRKLQNLESQMAQLEQAIKKSIPQLYSSQLTDPLLQIDESNPVLLLPLRLETRFANAGSELWIRVYPDQISIDTHETALTDSEIKAGKYFWKYLWENRSSPDYAKHRKKAWSQIANHFGANRATWIFQKTQPLKLKSNEDFTDILTDKDLDPGPVETKNQAWSQAAKSYVMPDLLKLRMFIGSALVFERQGNPIVQPLPVSPDPKNTSLPANLDWTGSDLAWLEDFEKAVEAGMAFKVDLSTIAAYDASVGFSRITVMGIRALFDQSPLTVAPPVAGTKLLSTLFENHQYTPAGLALVPQATPTNNTEEKESGFGEQPEFTEERFQQELQQPFQASDPDEMEDGKILALALGLDPILFQKLQNSHNTDRRDAVLMNKALYPATLGFLLGHLLHPLFNAKELETIRSFFCSYVTGRGPLSVLRVGPQPYGILPTSNFKTFQWNATDTNYVLFQKLTAFLAELDIVYEAFTASVPKLGQQKAPHLLLDEILELYPNTETFYQRVGYSENALRNCFGRPVTTTPNPLLEKLIKAFSGHTRPAPEGVLELKKIVLEKNTLRLNRNRLVDVVTTSESKKVSIPNPSSPIVHGTNYVEWLRQLYIRAPFAGIETNYYAGTDPQIDPPLLYLLLRHSLLLQLYKCVFHWLSSHQYLPSDRSLFHDGTPSSKFVAAKEYLNFFLDQEDISPMELLLIEAPHLPFLAPGETAAAYLLENTDSILQAIHTILGNQVTREIRNDFRYLLEFFPTLEFLESLSTAKLERSMIEHLDCLSYRLDAWQTALSYKKLEINRSAGLVTGTVLGAYGWLENVKPNENVMFMKEADLPAELRPGTGLPIINMKGHGGYIHAPSLTQAKTAALLRNAYLHHHDPNDPGLMAVNLSSLRVRKALEIFEGIQRGHTVSELLGYKLERHLHDQNTPLDKYIPVFRGAFPLGGKTLSNPGNDHDQPSATQENKPANWVARLDGLAIVNAIKGGNTYPFGLQLPGTGGEAGIIQEGIADLLDSIDAMKDVIVTESIHQLVQGNTERAGALLKSIHELKAPSKFEAIQTPRTPVQVLTHRASVLFNSGNFNTPANPWPTVKLTQRAATEPGLNAWLGEIIGSPDTYQCTVSEIGSGASSIIRLKDLNLQPIDLVYIVPTQLEAEESEFSQRIIHHYRVTKKISENVDLKIAYDKAAKNNLSLAEILPLLKLLKEIVTNSKPLDAADFDLRQHQGKSNSRNISVEKAGGLSVDIGALLKRKDNLAKALGSLMNRLKQASSTPSATMCADMRHILIECCQFDIRGAFPKSSVGEDQKLKDELVAQSIEVVSHLQKMQDSLQKYQNLNVDELIQSFSICFGPAFKVLPVFHFAKNNDDEVSRVTLVKGAYKAEQAIFSFITNKTKVSKEKLIQNWLNELLYLRPKLASFELVRLLYNSFREKQLGIHIMQLPYEADDSWLGLEFPASTQAGKGKLSMLVHHFPQNTEPNWEVSAFSGLLLDEWIEEIPDKEELTGISFQYNQPDSQPPQVLLLAISPTEGKQWNWDKLSDIIDDTLRRAKQRAVGLGELANTDWIGIVPAVVSEFSDTKANISLLFRN